MVHLEDAMDSALDASAVEASRLHNPCIREPHSPAPGFRRPCMGLGGDPVPQRFQETHSHLQPWLPPAAGAEQGKGGWPEHHPAILPVPW